ncbi:MAG: SDR family NAD(P)-dependent oxidoreductase, partial [Gemmatimonadota bacterium]|nr:SDR family NAD(P)-dependent oxidoreductase [Gemmatimonadota bacterium]
MAADPEGTPGEPALKLEGRVALITGGGTGIGAATARLFAEEGAAVCVTGRREAPLEEVVTAIQDDGGRALAIAGDVAITEDCQRMADETIAAFGRIDVLVNNAGTGPLMDAERTTD